MVDGLLNGFRALDLSGAQGYACGKMLATLGVDVIKVEQPGGDPGRNMPPFMANAADPERSLYWMSFNTDKRSITLDLTKVEGRKLFLRLVEKADFVLESFNPGYLDSLGLGYETLSRHNPRIILTSITPFGQKGPYSQYKGSELIYSAMSGIMETTGDRDRAPLKEGPDSITYRGNAAAALGSVIAHFYRQTNGEGQQVDVAMHEVDANRLGINLVLWQFDKVLLKRSGPIRVAGARYLRQFWPCKDGYIFWAISGGKLGASRNRGLSKWLDDEGVENLLRPLVSQEGFDMSVVTQEEIEKIQYSIAKNLFLRHTKDELMSEAIKRGIDINAVNNVEDVLKHPQLQQRGFWQKLSSSDNEIAYMLPKYLFSSDRTNSYVTTRAPVIGEHNRVIYSQEMGITETEISYLEKSGVI